MLVPVFQQTTMNYYYDILQVPFGSPLKTIKLNYQKLLLETHPDRKGGNNEKFVNVQNAWKMINLNLENNNGNKEKHGPIQDEFYANEFKLGFDGLLIIDCRCGDVFQITREDLPLTEILECNGCSLCIRIKQ